MAAVSDLLAMIATLTQLEALEKRAAGTARDVSPDVPTDLAGVEREQFIAEKAGQLPAGLAFLRVEYEAFLRAEEGPVRRKTGRKLLAALCRELLRRAEMEADDGVPSSDAAHPVAAAPAVDAPQAPTPPAGPVSEPASEPASEPVEPMAETVRPEAAATETTAETTAETANGGEL